MDVTESAFAAYDGAAIPEPTPREALHPRNVHWSDGVWGFDRFTPEASRRSRQAYMAMVTMLDGWIGELLGVLEERGTLDETLVVYTSDHGDMWGEHGLWGKNLFYEPSARVPLILSAPALGVAAGERVETPVSLLDLYPTFRDAAGAADWRLPLDGRSLWPAARGETALEDAPVFCEYYGCDTKGPERMVRWKRWKYIYYHDQPGVELYDLAADPDERVNRAGDPACADVEAELHRMLMDGWDPEALARDIREDQNRRSLIGRALQNR
jgi:choline-sulfatase